MFCLFNKEAYYTAVKNSEYNSSQISFGTNNIPVSIKFLSQHFAGSSVSEGVWEIKDGAVTFWVGWYSI